MRTTLLTSMAIFVVLGAACSSSEQSGTPTATTGGSGPTTGSSTTGSSTTGSSTTGSTTTTGGSGGSGMGPGPIPSKVEPGSCGLAQPAFCEKFSMPNAGGRGGDLDENIWSFARWAHAVEQLWVRMPASTNPQQTFPSTFCGQSFTGILPPNDSRMCEGKGVDGTMSAQLNEVFDDEGDFAFHSMRIRQPFDFTDRTGKLVWDVDAKINPLNVGHGWWFEVWITEDPAPMPYHEAPAVTSLPRKGLGLALRFGGGCPKGDVNNWQNALETTHVTDDFKFLHAYDFWQVPQAPESPDKCIKVADARLNHFELRVSKDRLELWASDYENPSSFKLRTTVPQLDLTFTRGYIHFQHAQYNATKDGNVTRAQTFRWDNVGFDGPAYPTPRAYDIPDNTEMQPKDGATGIRLGWKLADGKPQTFTWHGVDLTDALSATFNFDVFESMGQSLQYRFNGKAWHTFTVPTRDGSTPNTSLRGFSVQAPLEELVSGDNTVEVQVPNPDHDEGIGNMDLTIEVPR